MKKFNFDIIKDLIISILIVIAILLIVSVIFYDDISLTKTIPETQEYAMTDEMKEDLNYSYIEDTQETITTYSIDASDLKKYEKNNQYVKGKKNPFAVESDTSEQATINGIISDGETTSSSGGFYEDEGIK